MARFAHIADCHLGAFRDPALREKNIKAFEDALAECAKQNIDFAIIAGDLFDISIPDLAVVERAVRAMRSLGKPIYAVYGSHDYSPTQTSVIDVLNEAGVLKKVSAGNYVDIEQNGQKGQQLRLDVLTDPKTGVKITGISARKLGLEKTYFHDLDTKALEGVTGPKIFVFHCAIEDFKPLALKRVDAVALSVFPKGFDYYAGGHVHARLLTDALGGKLAYPGPLSAADFRDLEEMANTPHGFYIVDLSEKTAEFVPITIGRVHVVRVNADGLTATHANEKMQKIIQETPKADIVLLHVKGTLSEGKPFEVDIGKHRKALLEKSAIVYVNNALEAKERIDVAVDADKPSDIEKKVFAEMLADRELPDELSGEKGAEQAVLLLNVLKEENPGENKKRFDDVLAEKAGRVLNVET